MTDALTFINSDTGLELDRFYFYYGNVVAGSMSDKVFAVQNLSTQYTAENIVIKVVENSGDVLSQMLLSIDGIIFTEVLSIGDLPPGSLSEDITLRRYTKSDAATDGSFSIVAQSASWT